MTPPTVPFYSVPPGTPASKCRGANCGKTVFWIMTPRGKMLLVDCDVEGGRRPSAAVDPKQLDAFSSTPERERAGRGVSHFTTCPDAAAFSHK